MSNEIERFKTVTAKNYKDQAIFFLNAFWPEHGKDAEDIWKYWERTRVSFHRRRRLKLCVLL